MRGYVKLDADPEHEAMGPFEKETIAELHELVLRMVLNGAVSGVLNRMSMFRESGHVALAKVYENFHGDTVSYVITTDDETDAGVVDISAPALKNEHLRVLADHPDMKGTMIEHVNNDCGNPNCPVRSLAEAFGISSADLSG